MSREQKIKRFAYINDGLGSIWKFEEFDWRNSLVHSEGWSDDGWKRDSNFSRWNVFGTGIDSAFRWIVSYIYINPKLQTNL